MKLKSILRRIFSKASEGYIVVRTYSTIHDDGYFIVGIEDLPMPTFFKEAYKNKKWIYTKAENKRNTYVLKNIKDAKRFLAELYGCPLTDALEIYKVRVKGKRHSGQIYLYKKPFKCEWWEWLRLEKCVASVWNSKNVEDIINA